MLCLSIVLNGALFAFHVVSAVEIIRYGNDVLQSHQDSNKDHSSSPIIFVTLSFCMIVVTYISAVLISVYRWYKEGFDSRSLVKPKSTKEPLNFRSLAVISVIINIIHIVCYFLPYMLLAFIYNPIQTCVTYLALGFYVLCIYLLFWILKDCYTSYKRLYSSDTTGRGFLRFHTSQNYTKNSESINKNDLYFIIIYTVYFLLGYGIVLAVVFFSAVIFYVLTLGSLNDFEVIQNLIPPLLIGILTYFVIKPTYKQAKEKINLDDESRIEKLLKDHTKENTKSDDRLSTDQQHIATSM